MSKFRASAIAAAAILLLMHGAVLMLRYGTETASLWGDWIEAVAILRPRWSAGLRLRRSGPFGRRFGGWFSFRSLLALAGQVALPTTSITCTLPSGTLWPSDILVFFWVVPAMMTLFLGPGIRTADSAGCASAILRKPARWCWRSSFHSSIRRRAGKPPSRSWRIALSTSECLSSGCWLEFSGARALSLYRYREVLFLRLAVFFSPTRSPANLTLYGFAKGDLKQGIWMDLLWTAPIACSS